MTFLDFAGLRRPKSPNTCLIAPQDFTPRARVDRPAPEFDMPPEALWARLEMFVRAQKAWRDVQTDPQARALSFVAVSALMRFKDDVDVRVLDVAEAPEKSTIAIYSRSRVGYSDMGANAKRADKLLAALR